MRSYVAGAFMANLQDRVSVLCASVSNIDRVFLFSFPGIGFLTLSLSSPTPAPSHSLFKSLPEASRPEGEILGTDSVRAPNYKTLRWLVVAKFSVLVALHCTLEKKSAMVSFALLETQ